MGRPLSLHTPIAFHTTFGWPLASSSIMAVNVDSFYFLVCAPLLPVITFIKCFLRCIFASVFMHRNDAIDFSIGIFKNRKLVKCIFIVE